MNCTGLTDITIPDSVTYIGGDVFNNTPWLEAKREENPLVIVNGILIDGRTCSGDIVIPESVTSIGSYAFGNCTGLTSIVIPDSVTSIGSGAFGRCKSLTNIVIPDSVTSIGSGAFGRCKSLTNIVIPDGVTSIGFATFYGCHSLTSIVIPDGVTNIGNIAFGNCTGLTSIVIPDSVTSIGSGAFDDSTIDDIVFPPRTDELTIKGYAGSYAETYATEHNISFESLSETPVIVDSGTLGENLTWTLNNAGLLTISGNGEWNGDLQDRIRNDVLKAVIEDGVTNIGERAFSRCENLKSITIPDGVTSIDRGAFYACHSLTGIVLPDSVTSIGERTFYACHSLTSIVIPDGVTSIGNHAFRNCTALTSIVIPDSVTSIGIGAFDDYDIDDNVFPPRTDELTIKGYAGSYAETYATEHNISFELLGNAPVLEPFPDMDGDGEITARDAQKVLSAFAEILSENPSGLTPEQEAAADVTGDHEITAIDAQYILTYFLNNTVLEDPITWNELLHPDGE